jgi:hypothetical protein
MGMVQTFVGKNNCDFSLKTESSENYLKVGSKKLAKRKNTNLEVVSQEQSSA